MDLFHVLRGSGEPLLLIQGMSGNHLHWGDPFLELLEEDFELCAFDNRGMGKSPRVDGPFTIADLAQDALGVLDAVGWESAHVLGISMGGMIAQELVLAAPQRVRSLTLGCSYCGGAGSALMDPSVGMALFEAMKSGDRERAIRVGFEINVSAGYAGEEANFTPFREIAMALPAPVPVTMLQSAAIVAHDTSARLGEIEAPTLILHGDQDRVLPVRNGEQLHRLIPGSRLEIFEGVGHLFWWERPQESAALIAEHALARARG